MLNNFRVVFKVVYVKCRSLVFMPSQFYMNAPKVNTNAIQKKMNESDYCHQMQDALEQFNRLSESFVSSYQCLEDEVEDLASQLREEIKDKERQLVEKEKIAQKLSSLLSILPTAVIVIDGDGIVQDCNAVARELLGEPLLKTAWINIIHRVFSPRLDDGHEISLKDGRRVRIETRALDYEPGQLVVLTDLTETRNLQDSLNRDRRLVDMGKLIASLAHQIRTPLSSALLYASHIQKSNIDELKKKKFANRVLDCIRHIESQISDMLLFAKGKSIRKNWVYVGEFYEALQQHITHLYKPNLDEIHFINNDGYFEGVVNINMDALLSAIVNLIDNALDACCKKDDKKIEVSFIQNKERVDIMIADNGRGFEPHQINKIFEPFFTTKEHGTGLGLAVVKSVISDHAGDISVRSKLNEGTTFKLCIPIVIDSNHEHCLEQVK